LQLVFESMQEKDNREVDRASTVLSRIPVEAPTFLSAAGILVGGWRLVDLHDSVADGVEG
jgi:hypothetical protein